MEQQEEQNVQLKVQPAAKGSESADTARLIHLMYQNWVVKQESVDCAINYDNGLLYIRINGPGVFDKFKDEHGVHRVVRVSPHDPQQRRHTTFVIVEVDGMGELPFDLSNKKVRNYIYDPYQSVKDLRTGDETDKIDEVMNGNIEAIYEKNQ